MEPQQALNEARHHVSEAERRIAEQRKRIEELRRDGHDTKEAEKLLDAFEKTLHSMREHLQLEEQEAVKR